jgi:hypothetical protein
VQFHIACYGRARYSHIQILPQSVDSWFGSYLLQYKTGREEQMRTRFLKSMIQDDRLIATRPRGAHAKRLDPLGSGGAGPAEPTGPAGATVCELLVFSPSSPLSPWRLPRESGAFSTGGKAASDGSQVHRQGSVYGGLSTIIDGEGQG